jgi:hypothetical protein
VEVVILGCVDFYVRPRQGADPYFHLLVSNRLVRLQRWWLFLCNDATTLLTEVIGRCPTAQPCWGYGVAKKDLLKLQPVLNVLKSLI